MKIHEWLLDAYIFLPSSYEHPHSGGQSWQSNHHEYDVKIGLLIMHSLRPRSRVLIGRYTNTVAEGSRSSRKLGIDESLAILSFLILQDMTQLDRGLFMERSSGVVSPRVTDKRRKYRKSATARSLGLT